MAIKKLKSPGKLDKKIGKHLPYHLDMGARFGPDRFEKISQALPWCRENLGVDFLSSQVLDDGSVVTMYDTESDWYMLPNGEFRFAKLKHLEALLEHLNG